MPRRYGPDDLLEMPGADLQRALLGVADEFLARAVFGASPAVRAALLGNVSSRRRANLELLVAALKPAGALDRRSARDSLLRLIAQVFRAGIPAEAEDARHGECRRRPSADGQRPEPPAPPGPDITPGAFARLKEAGGIVAAFEKFSPQARHLANCRRGLSGAVLIRSWLGRQPGLPADKVIKAMCSPPPKTGAKRGKGKRG